MASGDAAAFDDPGVFREIPLVNLIRERVKAGRANGYPGVTGITKRLLEHWKDPEEFESRRFFFCQLEAAETFIWLAEAPPSERVGIGIPSDGGALKRLCAKMATGSGKTVVMAMVIAWHVLNKVANPRHGRFAKHPCGCPGLTVRSRLAVLGPSHPENYYEEFRSGGRLPGSARSSYHRGPTPPHHTPEGGKKRENGDQGPQRLIRPSNRGRFREGASTPSGIGLAKSHKFNRGARIRTGDLLLQKRSQRDGNHGKKPT